MNNYEKILRPLLFRLDAESAHNIAMSVLARGLIRTRLITDKRLKVALAGMSWENPIGLAAGLDKNGVAIKHWHKLGFAAVEIGTITHLEQPGNPRPRLFRIPNDQAIINRMGFNNDGAIKVSAKLRNHSSKIPLGINLGKSKVTDLNNAAQDYADSYKLLRPFADYVVINVSSPNTPGLRSLQTIESLSDILSAMKSTSYEHPPIYIKLAPDLLDEELLELAYWGKTAGISGWICTNTSISRSNLKSKIDQQGGLSGKPLFDRSNEVLSLMANHKNLDQSVIGVGGIFTGADVLQKLKLGANAVQMYSGWVYRGPNSIPNVLLELLNEMNQEKIDSLGSLFAN